MAGQPRLSLPDDSEEDIWSYYELLQIASLVFDGHLAIIIQILWVDRSLKMNIYGAFNLPVIHPKHQKSLQYILKWNYLAIISDEDYATLPSGQNVIVCTLKKWHICQIVTALHLIKQITLCIFSQLINSVPVMKEDCRYYIKPQSHNLSHSLKRGLWAISALATEKKCWFDVLEEHIE